MLRSKFNNVHARDVRWPAWVRQQAYQTHLMCSRSATELEGLPDSPDRRLGQSRTLDHRRPRPVRGIRRRLLQRGDHDRLHLIDADRGRASRPGILRRDGVRPSRIGPRTDAATASRLRERRSAPARRSPPARLVRRPAPRCKQGQFRSVHDRPNRRPLPAHLELEATLRVVRQQRHGGRGAGGNPANGPNAPAKRPGLALRSTGRARSWVPNLPQREGGVRGLE